VDDRGSIPVRNKEGTFLYVTATRPALGPIQWVLGTLSLGVKREGREADHSLPSSAEIKTAPFIPLLPQYVFVACCLIKQ
jgi:hypothetical protein